jgi:hypothetical protein
VKLTTYFHLVPMSKNAWSYTSIPQYSFMAWCSVKKSTGSTLPLPLANETGCKLQIHGCYSFMLMKKSVERWMTGIDVSASKLTIYLLRTANVFQLCNGSSISKMGSSWFLIEHSIRPKMRHMMYIACSVNSVCYSVFRYESVIR